MANLPLQPGKLPVQQTIAKLVAFGDGLSEGSIHSWRERWRTLCLLCLLPEMSKMSRTKLCLSTYRLMKTSGGDLFAQSKYNDLSLENVKMLMDIVLVVRWWAVKLCKRL